MVRYLLHNENSVYDAATGRYHFRVDRRFANPSAMTVRKVTYTKSSGETTSPPLVYLRSDALHKLVSSKHTVQLTAAESKAFNGKAKDAAQARAAPSARSG